MVLRNLKMKKFRIWLAVAAILAFINGGIMIMQTITGSLWDGKQRINLAIGDQPLNLVSYSPAEEELVIIHLPDKLFLKVAHGYGEYLVQALPGLAELENRKELTVQTLEENFAVPIEGWITVPSTGDNVLNVLTSRLKRIGGSNLSTWDILRLWWGIRGVKTGGIKEIYLNKDGVLTEDKLDDQTMIYKLDTEKVDLLIQKYFIENRIRKERLTTQVLNATFYPGLALKASRILTNIGVEVIDVNNSELRLEKCEVKSGKNRQGSATVKKIIKIFACDWFEEKENGRAEITLILGEDYWRKLNVK